MKKLLCTLLALSMLLGLAACGGPAPAESPSADPAPAVSTPAQPEDGSASFTCLLYTSPSPRDCS